MIGVKINISNLILNEFEFGLGELTIVQPSCEVFSQSNSRVHVKGIALERQVVRQELIAYERDAVRLPLRCVVGLMDILSL